MRKGDTKGEHESEFVAGRPTKSKFEESECMYVLEIRHVAKVCELPLPIIAHSEVLDGQSVTLLKQRRRLPPGDIVPDPNQGEGVEIWTGRKPPAGLYVPIDLADGESLEGGKFSR